MTTCKNCFIDQLQTFNMVLLGFSKFFAAILLFNLLAVQCRPGNKMSYRKGGGACEVHKGWLLMDRDKCRIEIPTFGCRGGCFSSAKPFSHRIGFASSCACCAPIESTIEEREVQCNGQTKVIRYPVARKCACRPCLNGS